MTINLRLILSTTRIQKQFPPSVFVFIDYLVVSASQDAGGYAISHQNNLKLPYLLSYFTLVCLQCGRTVGRTYGHVTTQISWMNGLPNSLTHGAPLRVLGAHESSAITEQTHDQKRKKADTHTCLVPLDCSRICAS